MVIEFRKVKMLIVPRSEINYSHNQLIKLFV